jgi:hypothetical protein
LIQINLVHPVGLRDVAEHSWATMAPSWYVTFEIPTRGVLPKRRSPRETRTFDTEADAKEFARGKLSDGMIVFAGTINPHSPRQIIPSNRIHDWLADEQ